MSASYQVDVVAADRMVWEGQSTQVVATTTEGEVGILAGHIPFIGALVPGSVQITAEDGRTEVIAVDGGFLSVSLERVAVISPYAQLAEEISLDKAQRELREVEALLDAGDISLETERRLHRAQAQVSAASRGKPTI